MIGIIEICVSNVLRKECLFVVYVVDMVLLFEEMFGKYKILLVVFSLKFKLFVVFDDLDDFFKKVVVLFEKFGFGEMKVGLGFGFGFVMLYLKFIVWFGVLFFILLCGCVISNFFVKYDVLCMDWKLK